MTKLHHRKFLLIFALSALISMTTKSFADSKAAQYINDATITAKVKEAILADKQLNFLQISVNTDHGTVSLSGSVDTQYNEDEAVKIVKRIDGVTSVDNNMSVKIADVE